MARTILKEYWYVNNSLGVIQSDHPGRNKSGDPKPPNKKSILCWTEKGRDCWWFPDGSTQPCSEEDYGRTELLAVLSQAIASGQSKQEEKSSGKVNMFADMDDMETNVQGKSGMPRMGIPVLPDIILAEMEKQTLGFCPSGFMSPTERATMDIEFIPNTEFYLYDNKERYKKLIASNIGHDPDVPFWRYAIEEEWKDKWKYQWAELTCKEKCEPWRAEVRAFLAVVKDLASRDVDLGEITIQTVDAIKERFGKKKEEVNASS